MQQDTRGSTRCLEFSGELFFSQLLGTQLAPPLGDFAFTASRTVDCNSFAHIRRRGGDSLGDS
jgi:hypothetical protein